MSEEGSNLGIGELCLLTQDCGVGLDCYSVNATSRACSCSSLYGYEGESCGIAGSQALWNLVASALLMSFSGLFLLLVLYDWFLLSKGYTTFNGPGVRMNLSRITWLFCIIYAGISLLSSTLRFAEVVDFKKLEDLTFLRYNDNTSMEYSVSKFYFVANSFMGLSLPFAFFIVTFSILYWINLIKYICERENIKMNFSLNRFETIKTFVLSLVTLLILSSLGLYFASLFVAATAVYAVLSIILFLLHILARVNFKSIEPFYKHYQLKTMTTQRTPYEMKRKGVGLTMTMKTTSTLTICLLFLVFLGFTVMSTQLTTLTKISTPGTLVSFLLAKDFTLLSLALIVYINYRYIRKLLLQTFSSKPMNKVWKQWSMNTDMRRTPSRRCSDSAKSARNSECQETMQTFSVPRLLRKTNIN